jgi:hypothetical protein
LSLKLACGPPQHEKSSLVSRLVETWEKLPVHIQGEERQSVVKKKIKSWARRDNGGGGRRTGFHTRDQQPFVIAEGANKERKR